ncbi:DUF262 domain-containing protein [Photobacterium leiognathi]|uniref:DUF262 domain-containing protein n=1 Tax=Photobacterium leiognathi TaxID=553611 RepID=UPI00273A05C6|nr:DUF262 domain-containing protein [Photobacterium leiognathi]
MGIKDDIKSDYQTLCFLGSIITVNISDKIDTVSSPLNVVDGQQRLTSTLLLIQSLNLHLKEEFNSFSNIPDSIYRWIEDEIKEIEQNTIACLYSRKIRNNKYYEYLPKIVREGADTLSFRENKFKYSSPTSDYLHQFAKYICEDNKDQDNLFSWQQNKDDKSTIGIINALVFKGAFKRKDFLRHNDHSTEQLISEDNRFYSLDFDKGEIKSDLLNYNGEYKEKIERVIQLISFSRFIFFNVVVTEVRTYEKYQFDAFESLNTTGVPLTAIDIFRAKALSSYNDAKKESSISRDEIILLDKVDKYIQSIPQKSRSKESREVVSSFLLYISGIKPEEHLSWQRNKLIELYDKAETAGKVPNLVACLDQIVDFRSNFWKEKQLLSQLDLLDNSEEMLVYFDYFRQLNSTLLIPILARIYYLYYNDDSQKFVRMVKALSNFVLLWRLAQYIVN